MILPPHEPPTTPPDELPVEPSRKTRLSAHRARRKWVTFRWVVIAGAIFAGLALVASLAFNVIGVSLLLGYGKQNHDNTEALKVQGAQTQQAVQILIDCTTPGHGCYEKGQQGTRTAVQGLNKAASATALCARDLGNDTLAKMEDCVSSTLAGH